MDVMDKAYIPIPFQEEKLNPAEWKPELTLVGVKDELYIPIPPKKDELELTPEEWDELETLDMKDEPDIPIPSKELDASRWKGDATKLWDTCMKRTIRKILDSKGAL